MKKKGSTFLGVKFKGVLIAGTIAMMTEYVVLLSDSIIAGNILGETALTALTLLAPYSNMILFFSVLLAMGTGVNMSIQTGNGNRKGTNQYFTIGIGVSIVIGIAITIVSLSFFMKIVGSLAGGNPEIVYFVKWYYMGLCFLPLIQPVLTVLYVIGLNEGKERLCSVSSII